MKASFIRFCLVSILLVVAADSCSLDPFGLGEGKEKSFSLTRSEMEYVENNNTFAADILDMYYRTKGAPYDFATSPLSVQVFLGMLNACATDDHSAKICSILGYEDRNTDKINSFCKKVIEESPKLDPKTKVNLANIWVLNKFKGFTLNDSFEKLMKDSYHAKVKSMDFGETADLFFHDWVSQETEGMLDLYAVFPPAMDCFVVNAAYFKSEWKTKFDTNKTFEGLFEGPYKDSYVDYMNESFKKMDYYTNDIFSSIFMPFGNGTYEMVICLPNRFGQDYGYDVDKVINWLKNNSLPKKRREEKVLVTLPIFDIQTSVDIESMINDYYGVSLADANYEKYPLCGKNKEGQAGMSFSEIEHVAKVKVEEDGAEASAVTYTLKFSGINPSPGESFISFLANHPFVYMIREVDTGLVLFNGVFAGEQIN